MKAVYTKPEWAAAFAQDASGRRRKLIPVRVRSTELTGLLTQIVYIDLVGKDEVKARGGVAFGRNRGEGEASAGPLSWANSRASLPGPRWADAGDRRRGCEGGP